MEFNETTLKMLTDDPVGYLPATFPEALRQAASLYSIAEIDTIVSALATEADLLSSINNLSSQIALRATIASPTFTGTPSAPTPATPSNDSTLATTEFVQAKINSIYTAADVLTKLLTVDGPTSGINSQYLGGIEQADFARLASPAFTGNPTVPNQLANDISSRIANTQLVEDKINLIFSVNFTPANILSLVKAADGTGSGLDADLWRGQTPAAFVTPSDLTPYALKASPALTGTPTAPTAAPGDATTIIATTAFVAAAISPLAPKASPTFTGTPAAPTPTAGTNTTQIATTAFVAASFAPLSSPTFGGTPAAPTPAPGTNTTQLATTAFVAASFAPLASPTLTGTPLAPTPATADNTTKIATTAFVVNKLATIPFNDAAALTIGTLNDARLPTTMSPKTMSGLSMTGNITLAAQSVERRVQWDHTSHSTYIYGTPSSGGSWGVWDSTAGSIMGWTGTTGILDLRAGTTIAGQAVVLNNSGTYSINVTGNAGSATLATKASTLAQGGGNGAAMTYNWSGQAGQPTWLWGGNDGVNHYVWNPANFSVNYATTSGNTNAFGGQGVGYFAKNDGGTYSINISGTSANSSALNGQAQASAATANTVVSRDGSGNSAFNRVNSTDILTNGLNVPKTAISDAGEGISLNGGLLWVSRSGAVPVMIDREGNDGQVVQFGRAKTAVGSISVTGSSTTYGTSSDVRLKHDFQPIDPTLIDQINVYDHAWNYDPNSRAYGVKAQELYEVVPTAVYRGEDPVNDMWGVDYSKLVPILIAKVQDLEARLAALEA